jgi:hypothetical protein
LRASIPNWASASQAARDLGLAFGVDALAVLDTRLEQSEVLQLPSAFGGDAGAVAELLEVELLLPHADDTAPPAALLAGARRELLPDHAQRQELVALEAEDRLQPLDVVLGERR